MKWKTWLWSVCILLGLLTGCQEILQEDVLAVQEESQSTTSAIEIAEVADVVDGDTIKVILEGEKYTIRMVGIDTPESVHPDASKNTIYGEEASEYAKETFTEGQTVYLSKDVSDRDKYDRLLRYVWLEEPSDVTSEIEIREKMYNAKVILDGYANAYKYAPDDTLYPLFLEFEQEAAEENRGLWAENGLDTKNIEKAKENQETLEEIDGAYAFIGNQNTKKLHTPLCSSLPKEENRVYFQIEEDALAEGYTPDKRCMGE